MSDAFCSPLPSTVKKKTPVVLVDDHASIRQMLALILSQEGSCEIVGQASTGSAAIDRCRELQPRLVVLDLILPDVSGVELVRLIRKEFRQTKVLVYSAATRDELIMAALNSQPHGFVHKEDNLPVFQEALRSVLEGRSYFSEMVLKSSKRCCPNPMMCITEREREVLQLIAQGLTTKAIADRLGMAIKTVETHRSNLAAKLNIHDVATLTRFAIRHGLIV